MSEMVEKADIFKRKVGLSQAFIMSPLPSVCI